MASRHEAPSEAKEIVNGAVSRKKPLGLSRGFEPAHLVFPLARPLMRDCRSIVSPVILAVAEHNKRPRLLSFDPEVIDANAAEVILLFCLAATVLAPKLTDENITAIRNSLKDMRQAAEKEALEAWVWADINFHARMFVHAGVPLERRLKQVNDENQFYLKFLVSRENVPWSKAEEEHEAILDACIA